MGLKERQISFAGGELSPSLWGRTDLDRYPVGARTLKNFLVTPHGVITNRPGTRHIDTIAPFGGATTVRLYGMATSDFGGSLLVFRAFQILVYYPNSPTSITAGPVITTPYAENELWRLKFSQLGNILTITSPSREAYQLSQSATVWTLSKLSFDIPGFVNKAGSSAPSNFPVLYHGTYFAGDASHPERPWTWQVTRVQRDSQGRVYESMPYTIVMYQDTDSSLGTAPTSINLYPDHPITLNLYAKKGDSMLDANNPAIVGNTLVCNRIYRGRDGFFGFVGQTTADTFIDDGAEPDFSNPPPQGFNPFTVFGPEYPSCSAFFENRRYLASTSKRPSTVWGSAIEEYSNFDEVIPADDADALTFTLATERLESISALVSKRQLIALTSGGEWVIHGPGQNELVTPNSIAAHRLGSHGCATRPAPLVFGEAIFFVQARGVVPRALSIDPQQGVSQSADVSLMSRHLFDGYTIVDWAYAENPYSIIWVVRSDGKLLSCTYVPEQNMLAWAQHDIADGGLVESVTTLPDDAEDGVYVLVNRSGTRTLERFAARIVLDVRLGVFMDRAVTYNGLSQWAGLTATITDAFGSGGVVGGDVKLTIQEDESILGTQVGKVLQFDDPAGVSEPVRIQLTSYAGFYHGTVLNVPVPSSLFGYATDQFYYCVLSVGGLSHLEGRSVTVLADGNVVIGKTVSGGTVAFDDYVAIAHIGIGYNSDFESLDAIQEKGKQKIVKAVTLELEQVRGGLVGPSLDDKLVELRDRQVSDNYLVLQPKRIEQRLLVQDKYAKTGRVAFRQNQPLPATVLGITRELEYGGE